MIDIAAAMSAVVTSLRGIAGIDTASTDPSEVIAPGVLVEFLELGPATLTGRAISLQLALVVSDTGGNIAAATNLSALLAKVETYATADGPITARSVVLPSNPTPLPGLLFPLIIRKEET